MSKYKQNIIPAVDDSQFAGMKLGELKKYVRAFFNENFRNKTVKNTHKGISIKMSMSGLKHLFNARRSGFVKIKAVMALDEMLKYAEYSNFKEPDANDTLDILGYFNFKCKVKVEENVQNFRIVVRLTKDGKFYYDHSVKVRK